MGHHDVCTMRIVYIKVVPNLRSCSPSFTPSCCYYQWETEFVQRILQSSSLQQMQIAPSGASPVSFPCLLHTNASTSVSTLSMHWMRPHTLCAFVTGKMCITRWVRKSRNGEQNMGVYLFGNIRMCLWIKRRECLLYLMCEMDNLERGSKAERKIWPVHSRSMNEW